MAEVVQTVNAADAMSGVKQIFTWISGAWPWMLAAIIIIILGIVIYYLMQKIEEEKRYRDEPGYQVYKQLIRSTSLNASEQKIRKTWSPKYLLWFLFPPLFWVAFIMKAEHSNKIVDWQGKLIGYYRGEQKGMDGTMTYQVYKDKSFFFFENEYLIKFPLIISFAVPLKNEAGEIQRDKFGKQLTSKKTFNMSDRIKELPNGDIQLWCTGIEKIGLYYYCPDFILDKETSTLDLRKYTEGLVMDNTYQLMVTRLQNVGAKQMEAMAMWNPQVQAARKMPEKTKEELQEENN